MAPNPYLSEAFFFLLLVVPIAMAAAKLAWPQIPCLAIWLAAPILSWLLVNGRFVVDPPNMGFGVVFTVPFGWIVIPPILALAQAIAELLPRSIRGTRPARAFAIAMLVLVVALPLSAFCRWIPRAEAERLALTALRFHQFEDIRDLRSTRTLSGWTFTFASRKYSYGTLQLSRTGEPFTLSAQ